jgi:hypothetical protein
MGPRAGLDIVEWRKILPLLGLEIRPLGRPARSQSLYQLQSQIHSVKGDVILELFESRLHPFLKNKNDKYSYRSDSAESHVHELTTIIYVVPRSEPILYRNLNSTTQCAFQYPRWLPACHVNSD